MREERKISEQLESYNGSSEKQTRDKEQLSPPFHKCCFRGTDFLDDSKNKVSRQLITCEMWWGDETVDTRCVIPYTLLKGFSK